MNFTPMDLAVIIFIVFWCLFWVAVIKGWKWMRNRRKARRQ